MAFPVVPNVPGVPPLIRDPLAAASAAVQFLTGDLITGYGAGLVPLWGIFSAAGGLPVVIADTVKAVDYAKEYAIATYPMEGGAFQSYDKVDTPFRAIVSFTSGGSVANRAELLASIDAISGDLKFYDVVTPERVYTSANVQRIGWRRTGGVASGMITVDVAVIEIRTTAGAQGQNTQSPSGATPTQDGTVQPWSDVSPTGQNLEGVAAGQGQFSTTSPTGFNPAPVSTGGGFNLLPVT